MGIRNKESRLRTNIIELLEGSFAQVSWKYKYVIWNPQQIFKTPYVANTGIQTKLQDKWPNSFIPFEKKKKTKPSLDSQLLKKQSVER